MSTWTETDIEAMVAGGMQRDFSMLMNDTWSTFTRYGLLRAGRAQPSERGTTDIRDFLRERFVPAMLAARER